MSTAPMGRDERQLTAWHLLAFLGELVLWGTAAYAGWVMGTGWLRWILAAVFVVAIISVWAVWAAPRTPRRLRTGPRLVFITSLGVLITAILAVPGHWAAAVVALVATAVVVVAQWFDSRGQ